MEIVNWLRFPRTLALVAALYLLAMAAVFALLAGQEATFLREAHQTPGTVVALVARAPLGSTRESRSNPSLAPRVRYTVDGKTYDYTAAHGRYRQRLRVGDTVTVLYPTGDPGTARLRGEGRHVGPMLAGSFTLGAVVVALGLVWTRPSRLQRSRVPAHPAHRAAKPRSRLPSP